MSESRMDPSKFGKADRVVVEQVQYLAASLGQRTQQRRVVGAKIEKTLRINLHTWVAGTHARSRAGVNSARFLGIWKDLEFNEGKGVARNAPPLARQRHSR